MVERLWRCLPCRAGPIFLRKQFPPEARPVDAYTGKTGPKVLRYVCAGYFLFSFCYEFPFT